MALDLYIGTQTEDLPTISVGGITGASINVGGLAIRSERGTASAKLLTDPAQLLTKYGRYKSNFYGHYVVRAFFRNLQGEPGQLWVVRVTSSDAVVASGSINNANALPTWKIWAGQRGEKDPGVWGNQLMHAVFASSAGKSTLTAPTALNDTQISVTSVAPYKLYDFVTVAGASTYSGKVIAIDEVTNKLTLDTPATGVNAAAQEVTVVDRSINVYLKDSITGNIALAEVWKNLSLDPSHERYWVNVINDEITGSDYIFAEQLVTVDVDTFDDLPVVGNGSSAVAIAFTAGADGSTPSNSDYADAYKNFDLADINYLANAEVFSEANWDDGELYCDTRKDCVWIGTPLVGLSYDSLVVWANKRRKSRIVYGLNNKDWVYVDDPIGVGPSPEKLVPNVGHVMGYAIYITSLRGIHKVPASRNQVVVDIRRLYNETTDRDELKNLKNLGLNCISNIGGTFAIRSARTPSKLKERAFINATLMAIYFKKSFEDSLQDLENESNTAALLNSIRDKIAAFAYSFYLSSSNGGNETGFASFKKASGGESGFQDVVLIIADGSINPLAQVNEGILRVKFYFMAPAPAESILIGVGLLFNR